jgi:DNA (cytosine-5)-methyltransferase 3A
MRLNYLSLFSGIGGFECAIDQFFPKTQCLGFCEVEPNCLRVLEHHFPSHVCLGDVTRANFLSYRGFVDLVVGGSPCKDLSIANTSRTGLAGQQSRLFWHFVRCLAECQPRFFVFENVASMSAADKEIITRVLGVPPVLLNSAVLTAQKRKRLFWCNFPVEGFDWKNDRPSLVSHLSQQFIRQTLLRYPSPRQPYSRFLTLANVLEPMHNVQHLQHSDRMLDYLLDDTVRIKGHKPGVCRLQAFPYYYDSANIKDRCVGTYIGRGSYNVLIDRRFQPVLFRKCTELEIERLQGFPDGFTAVPGISTTQRLKSLGNAVSVPVIVYILHWLNHCIEQEDNNF